MRTLLAAIFAPFFVTLGLQLAHAQTNTFNIADKALYPTTYGTSGQCWVSGGAGVAPNWAGCGVSALTSAHLFVGNGSNLATDVALSGDCSMANTGAITCTKTSGASWLVKTTTYTAANADRILADSTGGAFTITLPASPTTGQNVQFKSGPTADTNNVTLARNGSTIMGAASNLLLDVANIDITLVYDGSTWRF